MIGRRPIRPSALRLRGIFLRCFSPLRAALTAMIVGWACSLPFRVLSAVPTIPRNQMSIKQRVTHCQMRWLRDPFVSLCLGGCDGPKHPRKPQSDARRLFGGGVIPKLSRTKRDACFWKASSSSDPALTSRPCLSRFGLRQKPSRGTPPIPESR